MSTTRSIIDSYKSALIDGNLGEEYITENPDAMCIRINTCSNKIGALYLDADYFNEQTMLFINKKIAAKECVTDPYFNFQILNAHNIIYLDGDWKEQTGDTDNKYRTSCCNIATADMELALSFLNKRHIAVEHQHIWVPTTFPITDGKVKMGYHLFIICRENIDSDMRKDLFNYVSTNCSYGTTVIDSGPIKSTQSLLPFATKMPDNGKPSRSYRMAPGSMFKQINHYANPSVQRINGSISTEQVDIPIGVSHVRYLSEEESWDEEETFIEEDCFEDSDELTDSDDMVGDVESSDEEEDEDHEQQSIDDYIEEHDEEPLELEPVLSEMIKREDNVSIAEKPVKPKHQRSRVVKSVDIMADIEKAMAASHKNFQEKNWTFRYGDSNRILFTFIDSLRYLQPAHRLYKMLADHNARIKRIFPTIMRYMYVNYTVDMSGTKTLDVGSMCEIMVRLMKPLVELAYRYHKCDGKIRSIEQEIRESVAYWFNNYGVDGMFKSVVRSTKEGERLLTLLPVYRDYLAHGKGDKRTFNNWLKDTNSMYDEDDRLWIKVFINRKEGTYQYEHYPSKGPKKVKEADNPIIDRWELACNYRRTRFDKFCEICRLQVKRWIGFIKDIIMDGITKEIKPFNKDHNDISFNEAFPEDFSNDPYNYGSVTHYVTTMRTWCLMFLFTGFYEAQDLNDSVRMIMTAFTRKFIWIDSSKKEPVTWLYNIKQTDSLEAYPYNQWIEDPKGSETEQWMSVIYDRFIRPSLLTIDRNYNLDVLLTTMDNAGIGLDTRVMNKLKPFGNLGTEIYTICKNVFKTFGGNPRPKMLHAAQADYFPMRNGWLKWIIKDGQPTGEYEFLTDTQDMYMGRYTQVQWDGSLTEYNKDCIEYRAVKRVIEQIYPDEEGREYCMRMFASVLYGTGYKDRLFVMYGTGSDGKTTIVNAVQALLGQSGFGADATVIENGRRIALNRNMKGLASTMKAEALLVNASAKSSHDEGGISEAVDVRLCNTQEPQLDNKGRVTLNGATIKGILSGTASSTRKIYQEATSSVINALIIMQTNYKPYVDDPTDGLKRRFTMYQHRSKFITNESSSFINTKYHYKADAAVAKALTDEPRYWQALFYILLEYAQMNLRERVLPLSKLVMPPCVAEACEETFTKYVISVMGAISNVIEKVGADELGVINFNGFKDRLKRWNDKTPNVDEDLNHPYRFCEARKPDDIDKEITRGLVQYFGGHMYRLKETPTYVMSDEEADYTYIERKSGNIVRHKLDTRNKSIIEYAQRNKFNTERFKATFLRSYAMTTIDSAGDGKCKDENNGDVYIVGWRLVEGLD